MRLRSCAVVLTSFVLLVFAGSLRSEKRSSPRDWKRGSPYERIARDDLRTSLPPETPRHAPAPAEVLRRRRLEPARTIRRGTLAAIQVNVDSAGNNIVGDAANEPSIAIDPTNPDRIVIAWRQFDTIASDFREAGIAYSHDRGASWTATTLDEGVFRSDPVLAADSSGQFHFASLSGNVAISKFHVELFRSLDGGVSWLPFVPAFGGDKQWMTVDRTGGPGDGHIYHNWNFQFGCCGPNDFTRSINGGMSFQFPVRLPAPKMKWGTMDVGPDGTLYLAGAALNTFLGHLFTRSTDAQNPAVTPTFAPTKGIDLGGFTFAGGPVNPIGLLGHLWIAADRSNGPTRGNVYVLGSVGNFFSDNFIDVHLIRSTDGGQSWSDPIRVNDDPTTAPSWNWFGTVSVAPNGRIDVIWNDTRNDPTATFSEVFYGFSLDGGNTWSANQPVTPPFDPHLGYPQNEKIGDYYHLISDNGGANLAFAATFAGEHNVYYLRIPADCNGNEIEDTLDVAGGALDCNNNEIPDECEPNADCNGNELNDICDIAAGTSQDCNHNNIPDDCEPNTDCNGNGRPDICDLGDNTSRDCNRNGVPDSCDISSGASLDVNADAVPDECLGVCCTCQGCLDTTFVDCRVRAGEFTSLGQTCLTFECPALPVANNVCAQAVALASVPEQAVFIDNRCATPDGPFFMPCNPDTTLASDLWYTLRSPCTGSLTLNLCDAASFDTVVAVYGGGSACACPIDNLTLIDCADDTCGFPGGPSVVTVPVQEDGCYTLRVGGWAGETGQGVLTVSVACGGCTEHQQCDDGNVCTTDRCDDTGACGYVNNSKPCNDGLYCTKPDVCSGGVCIGAPRLCPAAQFCDENLDRCVPEP